MILAVTGTDTDVGKTVITAALAVGALDAGHRVAIYKPTQTGVRPDEMGDAQSVGRWLGDPIGLSLHEGARLPDPMAPVDAALQSGGIEAARALPTLEQHVARVRELEAGHELVIVEGAGGLLVQLTYQGQTIADLATAVGANLVVVTCPDLGTLNHTELTLEAAGRRGFDRGTLVLGSCPVEPSAVHRRNLGRLEELARHHGWRWVQGPAAGAIDTADPEGTGRELRSSGRRLAAAGIDTVVGDRTGTPG